MRQAYVGLCFTIGLSLFLYGAWLLFFDPGTPLPAAVGILSPELADQRIANFPNLVRGLGAFVAGSTLLAGIAGSWRE